jgi:hypothetical protein
MIKPANGLRGLRLIVGAFRLVGILGACFLLFEIYRAANRGWPIFSRGRYIDLLQFAPPAVFSLLLLLPWRHICRQRSFAFFLGALVAASFLYLCQLVQHGGILFLLVAVVFAAVQILCILALRRAN